MLRWLRQWQQQQATLSLVFSMVSKPTVPYSRSAYVDSNQPYGQEVALGRSKPHSAGPGSAASFHHEKAEQNSCRTRSLYQGRNGGHLRLADRYGDLRSA